MPKTVDEGFREFVTRLTPSGLESDRAKTHRASIQASLKTNFGVRRFFRTGSFGNGTSIRNYSDVDYFASIPRENLNENSVTTLRKIRNVLDTRFPNTGVTVRAPAILVPFGNNISEWTEITPADLMSKDKYDNLIYEIPNRSGKWMRSSPDKHNTIVTALNKKLGHKVKPLIRFIKAWKYFKNVPINSFYLEMRIVQHLLGEESIVYSIDIYSILMKLKSHSLATLQDPTGISGYIYPCSTASQKNDALSKLSTAITRAENARMYERNEDIRKAFIWWGMVFGEKFPSYY